MLLNNKERECKGAGHGSGAHEENFLWDWGGGRPHQGTDNKERNRNGLVFNSTLENSNRNGTVGKSQNWEVPGVNRRGKGKGRTRGRKNSRLKLFCGGTKMYR